MEQAEALLVVKKKPPKLELARPPACGIRPLALEAADVAHAVGAAVILRGIDLELRRGQRAILRGPNGAGKSTLLKALSGALPLAAGSRLEDDRLRLGVFAQVRGRVGVRARVRVGVRVRAPRPPPRSRRCSARPGAHAASGWRARCAAGRVVRR